MEDNNSYFTCVAKVFKRYLYEIIVLSTIIFIICMVYFVKGRVGGLAWTAAIFVLGPFGIFLFLAQLVILIIRCFMKKKTRVVHMVASLLLAFPITILAGLIFIPYPDNANVSDAVTLSVPVKGDVVLLGGKDYKTHAVWPSERYAYDILEQPYDTGNPDLQSYGIYGKEVYAPIKGKIIEIHDGEEDIAPNVENFTSLLGNYIYMKIEKTGTYLIFAHLKKDSISAKVGDTVEVGTIIAQVGNSGTTSEPHLHFQHQKNNPCKSVIMIADEGLPITFK